MSNKLIHIAEELSKRHRSKNEVLESLVNERLNKSLEAYLSELEDRAKYVSHKNELKVLKKL